MHHALTPPPMRRRTLSILAPAALLAGALLLARATPAAAWGAYGHQLVGGAAAAALPAEMPAFFRQAGAQLAYLNPEPDRWLDRAERELDPALNGASAPEHFIDADLIPADRLAGALGAPNRLAYADTLRALGLDVATVGLLPYSIVELTQRLRTDFRRWRAAPDSATRRFIEQRIVDDAGILGHFVADASNPAHVTKHYNGWVGDNPSGYTTDRTFHSRFESAFVQAHVKAADLTPLVAARAAVHEDVRAATLAYLRRTGAELTRLYDLEKSAKFDAANTSEAHKRFAAERLAAGTTMLRDLWWTAWITSALPVTKERAP